jgi:hypothetical protein
VTENSNSDFYTNARHAAMAGVLSRSRPGLAPPVAG